MAIKKTTRPRMTFTKGSGQLADKDNRKTIKPTRRSVTSRCAFHLGRLTFSIARSNGLAKTVNRLKRLKSNCRLYKNWGKDGALLPSIICTAGISSANVAIVATPGMTTSIPNKSRRSPNERRSRWVKSHSRSTGPSGAFAISSARSWELGVGAGGRPDMGGILVRLAEVVTDCNGCRGELGSTDE